MGMLRRGMRNIGKVAVNRNINFDHKLEIPHRGRKLIEKQQ